jgi:putative restriction endonuclease
VLNDNGKLLFGPSRFVGYINNSMSLHESNGERDGRITDKAITKILGKKVNSREVEEEYIKFCEVLGIKIYSKKRVYWYKEINSTDSVFDDIENIINDKNVDKTERESLIQSRIGQGAYRRSLIKLWGRCSITSYDRIDMLRASHIKRWSVCNNQERLDKYNGLLLLPNLDLAFEKGLISFKDNGRIIISQHLNDEDLTFLGIDNEMTIEVQTEHKKYLKYHREHSYMN